MPRWWVMEPNITLWLKDEPLGYQPALGPRVSLGMNYQQDWLWNYPDSATDEDLQRDPRIFGFGTNWYSAWRSLLWAPTNSASDSQGIVVYFGGGGQVRIYDSLDDGTGDWAINFNADTRTRLLRQTNVSGVTISFELHYPDGAKDIYGEFRPDLWSEDWPLVFLTAKVDAAGRTILFQYDTTTPDDVVRLKYVVDADGKTNTLSYANATYTNLVTQVTDPYGRSASFLYNADGLLTNLVDVLGLSSSFAYDTSDGKAWLTNLVTPYGTTSFKITEDDHAPGQGDLRAGNYVNRAIEITEANGAKQLYLYREESSKLSPGSGTDLLPGSYADVPNTTNANFAFTNTFDNTGMSNRNSFHWGRLQCSGLSTGVLTNLTVADYKLARLRHWLRDDEPGYPHTYVSLVLSMERIPSPDGATDGQKTWYDHAGKPSADTQPDPLPADQVQGYQLLPLFTARVLPDGTTWFERSEYNAAGLPANVIGTYTKTDGTVGARTNTFTYAANNLDMFQHIGPNDEQVVSNYFNAYHQVTTSYNAANEATVYTYNGNQQLTSIARPSGLTTTNIYNGDGTLAKTIDLEINRTNSFTYANGLVYSHTDERGLTVTNTFDNLQRLTGVKYPDTTTVSNTYTYLDVTATKDRLGYWTYFGFNPIRQKIAETNANGAITRYGYCDCGALLFMTNAWGSSAQLVTSFSYDYQGNRTFTYLPDDTVTNWFNSLGQTIASADAWATKWFGYNNQGLLTSVTNAYGVEQKTVFDIEDRPLYVTDANNVSITNSYDALGRFLTRTYPGGGVEAFGYTAKGLTAYTNQLNQATYYAYDAASRKTFETNANSEVMRYTNNAAGDLLSLTDGKNQTTKWNYDAYGRVTNKVDQAGVEILRYIYDPDSRLTNRWSTAKGNTVYAYEAVGNLTNINYPASTDIKYQYDALNRLTIMVDASGTNTYTYTSGGQLWTEDGPWASDTVTNIYNNRMRTGLRLAQPTGSWTNGFGYDAAKRLTSVTSPAGTYTYLLGAASAASPLPTKITLANTSYITNTYDTMARLTGTYLKTSGNVLTNMHEYGYNVGNQRTTTTNITSAIVNYTYDAIGQLKWADSSTNSEDRGYTYDAAWNLNYRTNDGVPSTFLVDGKNQLTNCPTTTNTYDSNGNLITARGSSTSNYRYCYDDENQLVRWVFSRDPIGCNDGASNNNDKRTDFVYDGKGRLRLRVEYDGDKFNDSWTTNTVVRYIYDGMRVIQERNSANTPAVSCTRGSDLSGSLEGAGGIGGLLGRSHAYQSGSGSWTNHNVYHADGNGNVTYMLNSSQSVVASYRYDPFGNIISSSGTLAAANVYRFSSKEIHVNSGLYYYGYRFYHPNLQRWLNRDPLNELGFKLVAHTEGVFDYNSERNIYVFAGNDPVRFTDDFGLKYGNPVPPCAPYPECLQDNRDPVGGCYSYGYAAQARQFPGKINPYGGAYRHCVAACCLKRRLGFVGSFCIFVWDVLHEDRSQDSKDDKLGERRGKSVADASGSCETECLKFYPRY